MALQNNTKVIHIKDKKGTPDEVYIGRPSKWGNPFIIGKDGDRTEVIRKYKRWFLLHKNLIKSLDELRGKTLVCYCKPHACHGDILLEAIQVNYDK